MLQTFAAPFWNDFIHSREGEVNHNINITQPTRSIFMDRERYFHYPIKCPHCSSFNIGGGLYCGECGSLIHMPQILTYLEKFIQVKVPQGVHKTENVESIYACELERQSFGYRYIAMHRVGTGDLAIEFCGCPTCERLKDEIVDYFVAFETAYNPVQVRKKFRQTKNRP